MTDRGLEPGCPHFTPYLSLAVTSTWDIYWDSIICPLANISGNFTITNFRGDAEFGALTLQFIKLLHLGPFYIVLTFTSKEGLKSLSLDRNFDGVSRCNEGSFWSGCPTAGETGTWPVCCEITAWNALLWKRFISKGVMAVFLRVSRYVTGCSEESGFGFTPFVISVSKLCSRD